MRADAGDLGDLIDIRFKYPRKSTEALDQKMRRFIYIALRYCVEKHKLNDLVRTEGIKPFAQKAFLKPCPVPLMRAHSLELAVLSITS